MSSTSLFRRSSKTGEMDKDDIYHLPNFGTCKEAKNYEENEDAPMNNFSIKYSHFFPNFSAGLFLGLPYSTEFIKNRNAELSLFETAWCVLLTLVKLIFFVLFMISTPLYIPYKITLCTFIALGCMGFLLTYQFIRHYKKICMSIRGLCKLSLHISPDRITGSGNIKTHILLGFSIVAFYMFTFIKGLYSTKYKSRIDIPGIDAEVFRISLTATALSSCALCAFSIITCNNIFVTTRNVIRDFRTRLRDRYRAGNFCRSFIKEDIVIFRRISDLFQQLEDCLSTVLLIVSILCILFFFSNFNILLTRNLSILVFTNFALSMFLVLITFIHLIISGSCVIKEDEYLKQCLARCSEDVAKTSLLMSDIVLFGILSDNIRATKLHFSASGMFIIDKALILTVAGFMVTYSVIQYQFNL